MKSLKVIVYIFTLYPLLLTAQEYNFEFNNFTEKDGLCDNIIFALHKDKHNILWIGSQTGLSRFDGKNFYNFKQINENEKYVSNTVACLTSDSKGKLWGGTHFGLFSFDPTTGKFKVYFPYEKGSLNYFLNIFCNSKDEIFVSGVTGLLKYNKDKDSFEEWKRYNILDPQLNAYGVAKNNMLLDETNQCFWMAFSQGIGKLDYKNDRLYTYRNQTSKPLFQKRSVGGLTKSKDGQYWFFDHTHQKMIKFDPNTQQEVKSIALDQIKKNLNVTSTYIDSEEKIWISDWNYNLILIDQKNNNKTIELINHNKVSDIGSNFFWAALEDEHKSMWFGTINGLSTYNSFSTIYKRVRLNEVVPLFNTVKMYMVYEHPMDKSWWITTLGSDIIHYKPNSKTYNHYKLSDFEKNSHGDKPSAIHSIYFKKDKIFFLSDKGLWHKQTSSNNVEYTSSPNDEIKSNYKISQYVAPYSYHYDYSKILTLNE